MSKKRIRFMCTAFRDGFQSVYGARVHTRDFLPAVQAACDAGINYFEAGGGARFQSLYFYCNEDAFDMMDQFRKTAGPDANLQTLARGTNVVGLESQPSDIVQLHARLFARHGITTIRNFDALNDVNNLIFSGQSIVDPGQAYVVSVNHKKYSMTFEDNKAIVDGKVYVVLICTHRMGRRLLRRRPSRQQMPPPRAQSRN